MTYADMRVDYIRNEAGSPAVEIHYRTVRCSIPMPGGEETEISVEATLLIPDWKQPSYRLKSGDISASDVSLPRAYKKLVRKFREGKEGNGNA